MTNRRRKSTNQKDLTSRYAAGELDEALDRDQPTGLRARKARQQKIEETALLRAANTEGAAEIHALPVGMVAQVYSLFILVEHATGPRVCVVRKTLSKVIDSQPVVGDFVRFRDIENRDESGRAEAIIEEVLPRQTVLARADSFSGTHVQPIVANCQQMLIVVSLLRPAVKWGLVDRMVVAARSGGLLPVICLNKVDLAEGESPGDEGDTAVRTIATTATAVAARIEADAVLAHYRLLGIETLCTSVPRNIEIDRLAALLGGRSTVLAGHSGVGKSSLIAAAEPGLDLRIGAISNYTDKGRHTTTSARYYPLKSGGFVVDTPGVKQFGLWGVTRDTLADYYPDLRDGTAPPWRVASFERLSQSLDPKS